MVRLVYTVSVAVILTACSSVGPKEPMESSSLRLDKDLIRENAQAEIMRTKPHVNVDPDVALVRKIFTTEYIDKPYVVTERYTPKIHIYANKPISLEEAILTMARTLGYTPVFGELVDKSQKVIVRNMAVSLDSFAEAIEYQTLTKVQIFPETKVVLVTEKYKKE